MKVLLARMDGRRRFLERFRQRRLCPRATVVGVTLRWCSCRRRTALSAHKRPDERRKTRNTNLQERILIPCRSCQFPAALIVALSLASCGKIDDHPTGAIEKK